jgi:dihydroflavonol-4-reductase
MAKGDPVLVTGASGFVGSAVARKLSDRGFEVRALVRPSSSRANLRGFPCTPVEGDLLDAASVRRAAQGVRYIFHVAADYRLWAKDSEEIVRNNRAGTLAVMQAALVSKVERIVYTSSVATLSLKGADGPVDETHPLEPQDAIGAYKRSKVVAERLVERMAAEDGLPVVIVNPSTPIGPRDIKPTPTGRIIVEAATGKMPAFVETGLNLVHVDDVAEGHLLALDKGLIGERYILGGQDVELRDMLSLIAKLVGRKPPTISLPRGPLYPLAYGAEAIALITGQEPFLTADALRMSRYKMFFTSAKAQSQLGYTARPYRDGLLDAIAWFKSAGSLK